MKVLKRVVYVLCGLLLALAALVAYVAATFDPNQYKSQIAAQVKAQTQRTLAIEGDIALIFFPKIGVKLGRTTLSEFRSDQPFAAVDTVRVALALIPLLSKEVVVDNVVVEGLRATIVKRRDGTSNLDDLLSGDEPTSKPVQPPAQGAGAPMQLKIDGVRITKAALIYRDEQAGSEYAISDLALNAGRFAPGVPMPLEVDALLRGDKPKLEAKVTLRGTVQADLEAQQFSVAILYGALSGTLGADTFNASLEVPSVSFGKERLVIQKLTAKLKGVFAGVTLDKLEVAAPRLEVALARQIVQAEGLAITAQGAQAANRFDFSLEAPSLSITPDRARGAPIRMSLNAQGPQLTARAHVGLSGVEGSAKAFNIAELILDIDAKQGEQVVKGRLSSPLAGDLEDQVFRLPKLAGRFAIQTPTLSKEATLSIDGTAEIDGKKERAGAHLKARFDDSHIEARFSVSGFNPAAMSFDVVADQFNLDRYLPPETKTSEASGQQVPAVKEEPIDLSALRTLNAKGRVRVGELVASKIKVSDLRVDAKAANGNIDIDPLSAKLYQGRVTGAIVVDANRNRFAVRQNLSGVAVGALLRDAIDQDLLEGRGDVALDMTSTGTTVSALTRALNGSARLNLKDGAIKGINLGQALRKAKSFISLRRDSESVATAGEKTDFSELAASFTIKDGKAHNDDLSIKSPFLRMTGKGDLDLTQASVDYLIKAAVVTSSAGQGGKDRTDLAGLTVPVRVYGPLDALKFKLEFGSANADRQQLEEKKEALKEKLQDKLKEKLRGEELESAAPEPGSPAPEPGSKERAEEDLKKKLEGLIR